MRLPTGRGRWAILTAVGVVLAAGGLGGALALSTASARTGAVTWTSPGPGAEGTDLVTGDPSLSPLSSPEASPSEAASPSPTLSTATTPAPPPFAAITVEAEASTVTRSGSATVVSDTRASGGKLVTGLGNSGQGTPGVLQINSVVIPTTGVYRISLYYANLGKPGTRTAVITASGATPVTLSFPGSHNCCGLRYVDITLGAGVHTITVANPNDIAPAIDKIVVSRP